MNKERSVVLPVLLGLVLYALLGFALWLYISPEPGNAAQKRDFVQLMAQIFGGGALLFGLYFTWRRVEISQRTLETQQDQQVTERFTRAIEQLGATDDKGEKKLEIRLGGVYALERIARDSPESDYSTVMEVLTAYVRENAPWPPKESSVAAGQEEGGERDEAGEPEGPPSPQEPPADIKAIVDVLRRREEDRIPERFRVRLDLQRAHLEGANFVGANFVEANLVRANLLRANLRGANLRGANLEGVELPR